MTKVRPGPIYLLEIFPLVGSQKPMMPPDHKESCASTVNQEQVKQYNLEDVLMEPGQLFQIYNSFMGHDC